MSARKLDDYEFKSRQSKYPWKDWMDEDIWEAKKGEDFTCMTESFISLLYNKAYDNNMKVRVSKVNDTTVVFQFDD